MAQNEGTEGKATAVAPSQVVAAGALQLQAECKRLREELVLSRRELARVQMQFEASEERRASLSAVEVERARLAQLLARHLAHPPEQARIGGVRGWLARRLVGLPVSRAGDGDPRVALIEQSELFDAGWYLLTYPDVAEAGERPAVHYLYFGAVEGRAASPRFDTAFYLARYPDVREAGINPLVHYLQTGKEEGRLPVQPFYERATLESGLGA